MLTNHLASCFRSIEEAEKFAQSYLADEGLGSYYKLLPMRDGSYYNVEIFESDGYRIGIL